MATNQPPVKFANRLGARLLVSRAYLTDAFRIGIGTALSNEHHMRAAAAWLAAAHKATPDGGVSALYSVRTGWDVSYPETTGYIIPTLLNYSRLTKENSWREKALQMADWLLSIQLEGGAFPQRTDFVTPAVFDTGQIIFGLVAAYRETSGNRYLAGALRASQWLLSVQESGGAWRRYSYGGESHAYYTRVAWALLVLYEELKRDELLQSARRNLAWALSQQTKNGWFQNNAFPNEEQPSLHTIAYVVQGMLESGDILNDPILVSAAARAADELLNIQQPDGSLHGAYDMDWQARAFFACLTGCAQTAIIWLRLYALLGNRKYLEAAGKINSFLKRTQNLNATHPGIRGGIKGSYPINGRYVPYAYPNWAAKFFLDALILEENATRTLDYVG